MSEPNGFSPGVPAPEDRPAVQASAAVPSSVGTAVAGTPATKSAAPQALPRVLGAWDGIAVVVGSIIGSGIFLKVSQVDTALGDWGIGAILGVWILVGVVTLAGSLALAELAALYPHAGGPYVYLREAYGQLPAFLWGWTEFWVVRAGSVGALAVATAIYLNEVIALSPLGQEFVAIAIVAGLSLANIISTRWGANVQNLFTAIKVLFLAGLIVLPVVMGAIHLEHLQPVLTTPPADSGKVLSVALAAALMAVFWPYDGWINIAPVAEDIREPQRNVPFALFWGMFLVIVVYVAANLSYHLVLTIEEVRQSEAIAARVCDVLFGPIGAKIAAVGVLCSTFGATNSNMICGPRIYLAMARDHLFPPALHRLHGRFSTPANAILAQAIWTILLIIAFYAWRKDPKGAFDGLTDSVIIGGLIFYSLTVAAVYVLRWKRPELPRPYRTWGYPFTPALLLAVYGFAFVRQLIDQAGQTWGVLLLVGAGLAYYYLIAPWHAKPRGPSAAEANQVGAGDGASAAANRAGT